MADRPESPVGSEQSPAVLFNTIVQHCFADPHDTTVLEAQRELFWQIVQRSLEYEEDGTARAAIQAHGEVVDYLWFQPADARLPEGLVLVDLNHEDQPQYGELQFGLDYLNRDIFDTVTSLLRRPGLAGLLAIREKNFQQNSVVLSQAMKAFAAATPGGQWLQEFSSDHSLKPTRLSIRERLNLEAIISARAGHLVKRQFGTVSRPLMRQSPMAAKASAYGENLLDEERGSRRTRRPGQEVAHRLARLVTDQFIGTKSQFKGVDSVTYLPDKASVELVRAGKVIGEDDILDMAGSPMHPLYEYSETLGVDVFSSDIIMNAAQMAFDSTVPGNTIPGNLYAEAIAELTMRCVRTLHYGFQLKESGFMLNALHLLKHPPKSTGFGIEVAGNDERLIAFRDRPDVVVEESLDDAFDRMMEFREALDRGRVRVPEITVDLSRSYQNLLQDAKRFLVLSPDAPEEAVAVTLKNLGPNDPIVGCLGLLAQARSELASSSKSLSQGTLGELRWMLGYAERLQAEGAQVTTPADAYVSLPELAIALSSALAPLAKYDPRRSAS